MAVVPPLLYICIVGLKFCSKSGGQKSGKRSGKKGENHRQRRCDATIRCKFYGPRVKFRAESGGFIRIGVRRQESLQKCDF